MTKYSKHWVVDFGSDERLRARAKKLIDRVCDLWLEEGVKDPDRYREFCEAIESLDMIRRGIEPKES